MGMSVRLERHVSKRFSHDVKDVDLLGEAEVHCVEGDDEIFGVVDLLECIYNAWLATNTPRKVFVGHGVL